jgi:hypothetical protein
MTPEEQFEFRQSGTPKINVYSENDATGVTSAIQGAGSCRFMATEMEVIDFINNLLKSRQEKMIEAMENLRDKYKPAYEEIDKGIVIGLDKGIEVINTCKEINKII